jgi:hypothetical protein
VIIASVVPIPVWPYLWERPFIGILEAVEGVSHYEWTGTVLFRGHLAIMVGIHLVEMLKRHRLGLGHGDLPVLVGVGHDDHPAAEAAAVVHAPLVRKLAVMAASLRCSRISMRFWIRSSCVLANSSRLIVPSLFASAGRRHWGRDVRASGGPRHRHSMLLRPIFSGILTSSVVITILVASKRPNGRDHRHDLLASSPCRPSDAPWRGINAARMRPALRKGSPGHQRGRDRLPHD